MAELTAREHLMLEMVNRARLVALTDAGRLGIAPEPDPVLPDLLLGCARPGSAPKVVVRV